MQPASTPPGPPAPATHRLVFTGRIGDADVAHVLALVDTATRADGASPLSEHVILHLRHGGEGPDRNLLLVVPADGRPAPDGDPPGEVVGPGERLAGYAHLDPTDVVAGAVLELVINPGDRGIGYGRLLVERAVTASPDGRLRLWAHGDDSPARTLAASMGFREIRRLEQLRRSLYSPLPPAVLPDGISVRAFRPGRDDAEWLALNARAFADHPEQGGWTAADLSARMHEEWFDADGFLVATDPAGRMVAFHWTKVHGGTRHAHGGRPHAHEPIGEVYVVGVDPREQGRGLGRAMTLAGLHRLRGHGLGQAMLYVEADNHPALAVYRSLGFTHWDTDVMFVRRP